MAAMSAASLRAINRAGALQLATRHTPIVVARTSTLPGSLAQSILAFRALQTRHQSTRPPNTSRPEQNAGKGKASPPPPPTSSTLKFLWSQLTFRNAFSALTPRGLKTLYRQSPVELVAALIILASLVGISGYIIKVCIEYFYARQFTKYPAPIAKSLRRALYYTNIKSEPELARKWYKRALEQCDELGMDPFSDDVLGIRIQTAAWLEKIGNYQGAITVLTSVWRDCTLWVTTMEKGIADGTVDKSGVVKPPPLPASKEGEEIKELPAQENLWRKRNRLLAKAVGTSTKLGELYADDHVNDSDNAQTRLTWAVETALSESKRRSTEGVKPEEGKWLSPEEFGGAMESLAAHYEARSQFHLAVPLLFQALRLCQSPCHRPTIMNNLAVAFAQHPVLGSSIDGLVDAPATADTMKIQGMPTTRKELLEAAWNWARNAKTHAKDVEASQRTPECDEACAVALSNMADIAALRNDATKARRLFHECIDLSKKIGFDQGVIQAQNGLRALDTGASPSG